MVFWFGVVPALFWQLGLAVVYLVWVPNTQMQLAYGLAKLCLVIWPLLWWSRLKRITPKLPPQRRLSLWYGLISALIIASGLGVFWLLAKTLLLDLQPALAAAVSAFGLQRNTYLVFALGLALVHAGFEEWYWRSFVFRGLQLNLRWPVAAGISSVAFASHHAIVIAQFAPVWLSFVGAAVVGMAGYLWCVLYQRTGSVLGSWLSHVVADLGVMAIGYWIMFR